MLAGQRPRESAVARLWREEGPKLPPLDCDDGRRLRVLYPGRPSADAGPDFRDAMLLTETGELLRGDVEVHLRPGGWRAHGHHRDRRYNGVVLHVVMWPSSGGGETTLAMGARVPTVALYPALQETVGRRRGRRRAAPGLAQAAFWAAAVPSGEQRVGAALERAGDARFNAKTASFRARLRQRGGDSDWAGQLLYQGLMEALGYSRNREPFLALAEGLPLARLERLAAGLQDRRETLIAALLGGGGLLPGELPRGTGLTEEELRSALRTWESMGLRPVVEAGAWRRFRVRPANRPERRLVGMAHLVHRLWDERLLDGLARRAMTGKVRALLEALVVVEGGRTYIGRGRAGEAAVNAVLPFLVAWSGLQGEPALGRACRTLYRAWPPLPGNEVAAEAASRLVPAVLQLPLAGGEEAAGELRGARRQQGLHHLYRAAVEGPSASGRQASPTRRSSRRR